ncbi:MAG: DUF4956 domain-containing protein [Pirellulales bacterium]|nr:DUF4956 domain-containing protein [Pirellulales bacterium]
MEIFDVPLYDDDLIKMVGRFAINLVVVTALVRFVYYKRSLSKDYLFTYYMLSVVVFFICFTLKKLELQLGMAMGLFAIFGVLRYRTTTMPVREMSYLFTIIGIAVINALANLKVSWSELLFVNAMFTAMPALLESLPLLRQELGEEILYERIDLIRPDRHDELVADLQDRTGLKLTRIELGRIDLLRDTVAITAYYYPHEQIVNDRTDVGISRRVQRA